MPKRWSEVEANPAYQSLAPEQKAKAQEQYFNQVVAPAVGPAKVEAARSQFMARANKAPVQSEGPGMMERMGQGALAGAVPGVSTYKAVKEHGLGTDAAAALGGDVANVAMLGLAGPGKLLQQTALGAGMGAAGGALAPVAQKMGEMGRGAAESVFGTAQDSPSVLMNMIRNAPGTIGETLGELAPQLGIAALTGKIAKGMSKGPAPLPEAAQALAYEGGQPTAAMRATNPLTKSLLGTAEVSARTNPLLGGKFAAIDEANAMASKTAAQKMFGADVTEPGMNATAGRELQTSLGNLADERATNYKQSLGDMESKILGVKDAKGAIKTAKGLGPDMAAAIESVQGDVLPSVAQMFEPLKAKLASGKLTPKQIELELQDLRHKFDGQFASLKKDAPGSHTALDRSFGQVNSAIKDAYYNGLNRVSKGMGDTLREAKGDYAEASSAMNPLSKALTFKEGMAPETAASRLMQSGTENLQALKEAMAPEDWANTRQQIAKTILDQAKGKEGISAAKLKSLLNGNKNIRDIIPVVFGEGAELADMNSLVKMMETAKQNELGVVNPSGTFTQGAKIGQVGAALNPGFWPQLAAKTALDVGYTYGAVPAQNALRGAQSAAAPIAQRISNLPRNQVVSQSVLGTTRAQAAEKAKKLSRVGR